MKIHAVAFRSRNENGFPCLRTLIRYPDALYWEGGCVGDGKLLEQFAIMVEECKVHSIEFAQTVADALKLPFIGRVDSYISLYENNPL